MDIVVRNGTVIDPVSLNETRADVGIRNGIFAFVGEGAPKGSLELDAVVARGIMRSSDHNSAHCVHVAHSVGDDGRWRVSLR